MSRSVIPYSIQIFAHIRDINFISISMNPSSLLPGDIEKHAHSHDLTKISSRDFQMYDPQISTFSTFNSVNQRKVHSKSKISQSLNKKIWNYSATTLTRDQSPQHSIPQSERFPSEKSNKNKNRFLSLQLRSTFSNGVSFAKSNRKDHFLNKQICDHPASNSYHQSPKQSSSKGQRAIKIMSLEFEEEKKLHYINHSFNQAKLKRSNVGPTFNKCEKQYARVMHHGRHMPYQPEFGKSNPGIGKYEVSDHTKLKVPSYSMRLILQRFNEQDPVIPGPGAYSNEPPRPHTVASINQKGTFQQSKRTYLVQPDNYTPGPGAYLKK